MAYLVSEFVSEVERALDERGECMEMVWSLGPVFQRLVAEGGDLTVQGEYRAGSSGLPGRVLHVDAAGRFRLIVASFAAGKPTPVHSHSRWGLECGVSCKERLTVWTRVDDGSVPGRAALEVFSDNHIERGDMGFWYDAPRNIHRQWAEGGQPSCVVILMGGDGGREHKFDLEAGTYTESD